MRLSATSSLLSGRRDVLVVASVSCIYGIGNPVEFQKNVITIRNEIKIFHELNFYINWYKVYIQELKPNLNMEISE